jgi:hypothetical protein
MLINTLREAAGPLGTAALATTLMKDGGCPDRSRKAMILEG